MQNRTFGVSICFMNQKIMLLQKIVSFKNYVCIIMETFQTSNLMAIFSPNENVMWIFFLFAKRFFLV